MVQHRDRDTDEFSDEQIQAAVREHGGNKASAARSLGINRSAIRWRLELIGMEEQNLAVNMVVTSAQNNTEVHPGFWNSLQIFCEETAAELRVIPFYYQNPSAMKRKEPDWFDAKVSKFLFDSFEQPHPKIAIHGDIKIQATAINPIQGLESMTGGHSVIVGHSQVQIKSIPRPMDHTPVWLCSTGAVTHPNFSAHTKAGKRAAFDHSYCALYVRAVGARWWIWQLFATKDGSFIHHETEYTPTGSRPAGHMHALSTGDEHVISIDTDVVKATYGRGGIAQTLHPERLFVHDLFDGRSISSYDERDPILTFYKWRMQELNAAEELTETTEHLLRVANLFNEVLVVPSNHTDWFDRWLRTEKAPRSKNQILWYEMNAIMRAYDHLDDMPSAFQAWCEKQNYDLKKIRFLRREESYLVDNVDYSNHGDMGANGARGNYKAFARTTRKGVIGHTHTPFWEKGWAGAGVSTDLARYVKGLTSWDQCHVGQYANGKRTLMPIRGGQWRP